MRRVWRLGAHTGNCQFAAWAKYNIDIGVFDIGIGLFETGKGVCDVASSRLGTRTVLCPRVRTCRCPLNKCLIVFPHVAGFAI